MTIPPRHVASPDGNWLVWYAHDPARKPAWFLASLDATQFFAWPHAKDPTSKRRIPGEAVRFPRSQRWATVLSTYRDSKYYLVGASLRNAGDPHWGEKTTIPEEPDGLFVGVDHADHLILRNLERGHEVIPCAIFRRLLLHPGPTSPQVYEVPLPHPAQIWDVIISPDGHALAWVLGGAQSTDPYEIWLSDFTGGDFRRLLQVQAVTEPSEVSRTGFFYYWPRELRWLPSGRHLSYSFRNAIWTVPVE